MITIDSFYSIEQYNESLNALKNNNIDYKEYIHSKSPFNWYLELPSDPIMVNFETLPDSQNKLLLGIIKPARANEEYLLQRRNNDTGKKSIEKFVINQPLREAKDSDYSCFFKITNKEQLLRISKESGIKIYYFGKYYNNKFKIGLCNNKYITNFINKEDILIEKEESVIQMELDLNFRIFKLKDRLQKYTETPYFEDGKYFPVKIQQFSSI